jgi:hypothetical protein
MRPTAPTQSRDAAIFYQESKMKKIVIIAALAFVLCLSGCLGIPTAGKHAYNGNDQGALQVQHPYPDESRDSKQK